MENKIVQFTDFINNRKNDINLEINALTNENKVDESNFKKAKLNIYDVFYTMFQLAIKQDSVEKIEEFFIKKIETIPSNWRISLQKAKEFGDMGKVLIEEVKLEAVDEILTGFHKIWRD